jgi:tRNA(fMet)-specific endonuclease VapC
LRYLIDTNIAIHARDNDEAALSWLEQRDGQVFLSSLSLVELERGVYRHPDQAISRRLQLDTFLQGVPVIPFDRSCAVAYGRIIAELGWVKGRDFDRMIAAHAIVAGAVLVTNNAKDFRDIRGLHLEEWH